MNFVFERLGHMYENKNFFLCFFNVLMKTRYFNTRFVSLQYKNTNQYCSKCSQKFSENHTFFEEFFWAQLGPCGWARPSKPSLVSGLSQ